MLENGTTSTRSEAAVHEKDWCYSTSFAVLSKRCRIAYSKAAHLFKKGLKNTPLRNNRNLLSIIKLSIRDREGPCIFTEDEEKLMAEATICCNSNFTALNSKRVVCHAV